MSLRTYRRAKSGFRFCNRCDRELPATADFFLSDRSRSLGISYECRDCHRERKAGRENRIDRWSQMTTEQKAKVRSRQLRYGRTDKGRAVFLRQAYLRIDDCDMNTDEIRGIICEPCTYCGTTERPRGLDRIDNALPHIKGNVLPACAACNFARGDRFSVAEMKRIGEVIRSIFRDRTPMEVDSEVRP